MAMRSGQTSETRPAEGREPAQAPKERAERAARVGDAFMETGLFEEAIGEYKKAAVLDGERLEWQVNLVDAFATCGY